MAKSQSTETETRRRGRPASFPDQETVSLMVRIPVTVRDQAREIAAKREEPLNVVLARIIERAHRDAMRTRSRKAAAPTEG